MFATSHDEAAANWNRSALDSMPYKKTLAIQHPLAAVWPSHSNLSMRESSGTGCWLGIVKSSSVRLHTRDGINSVYHLFGTFAFDFPTFGDSTLRRDSFKFWNVRQTQHAKTAH